MTKTHQGACNTEKASWGRCKPSFSAQIALISLPSYFEEQPGIQVPGLVERVVD